MNKYLDYEQKLIDRNKIKKINQFNI